MKIVLSADQKLSYKTVSIALPQKQVNVKVVSTLSEK